eukprot:Gregarina_sp_Poly_1__4296@NODE_2335_length_2263_cov_50_285519_g1139_i1_p1_GENE_NODE_2335_length_2263_cov_50_285519_g1139_i1NODE_2335_length_2263_cov_50_285519_g1139_i1_p1_ORF_typecomplete_len559_score68_99SET/PF00856_28/1_6e10SET/PF00856_28/2_9e03_NODE_2335_length_2263_cov_50_285519_g1139_i1761752
MKKYTGSLDKSVVVINRYIKIKDYKLECHIDETKGRILKALSDFAPGSIILKEDPLYAVSVDEDNWLYQKVTQWAREEDFDYDPLWYWCALCSRLTVEDKDYVSCAVHHVPLDSPNCAFFSRISDLLEALPLPLFTAQEAEKFSFFYAPVGSKPLAAAQFLSEQMQSLLQLHNRPAKLDGRVETILWDRIKSIFSEKGIEMTLQAWVHNCFDTGDDPVTYSTFFLPTFCSHSCQPNSVWTLDDAGKFVLVARSTIKEGEEISLSYLGDSDLFMPTWKRKQELCDTKHFECTCERCTCPSDVCRGFRCPSCMIGTCFMKSDREFMQLAESEIGGDNINVKILKDKLDELISYKCLGDDVSSERKLALGNPLAQEWWLLGSMELQEALSIERLRQDIQHITPETCQVCNYEPAPEEINEVLLFEAWVALALEAGVASSKTAENWYRRVLCRLTQHFYVISFINDYAVSVKEKSPAMAQRLLTRKMSLQRRSKRFCLRCEKCCETEFLRSVRSSNGTAGVYLHGHNGNSLDMHRRLSGIHKFDELSAPKPSSMRQDFSGGL